VIDVIRTVNNR